MNLWTIYHRPSDFPGAEYVVRQWAAAAHGAVPGEARTADTLEAARALIPSGLVRFERADTDDATIVEVWL